MPIWFEFLLALVWWALLLPLFMLIATPLVLVLSLFNEGPYWENLKRRYQKIIKFWTDWGWGFSL